MQNPYTASAIAFYEDKLADGNHIAVVGGSDSHQGGNPPGVTDAPVGAVATMVYADELSADAISQAIKGQHTYVKPYGNRRPGPRPSMPARPARANAIIGDDLQGQSASFDVTVDTSAASQARPGTYTLNLLKDGAVAQTSGDHGQRHQQDLQCLIDGPLLVRGPAPDRRGRTG